MNPRIREITLPCLDRACFICFTRYIYFTSTSKGSQR